MVDSEVERLLRAGKAEIKMVITKKSNTALASAALFLTTGILAGGAKEEQEVITTTLFLEDDRLIIQKPRKVIKFKDIKSINTETIQGITGIEIDIGKKENIEFASYESALPTVIGLLMKYTDYVK
ncbi:hypothetical protein [Methanobrevibacter sp.]|uniref:hypothetical protein n=1 Tax=Methanobrevibacter sp. TaxID=66852 RepID=UPI003D7EAA85